MVTSTLHGVLRRLRRWAHPHDGEAPTDGDLLGRYLERRDEAAFEALLVRHGPMVHGVCRRILANADDADDAFQATFLVLVRKAASVVPRVMVGNWLYGVAYRTAMSARAMKARRRAKERSAARPEARYEEVWTDLRPLLDEELSRLPDKYRVPVVLCDLEAKTLREAARQLGWPDGTLSTRLRAGRALLATALARRGLTLTSGALAATLASHAAAASVPAALATSTRSAAALFAGRQIAQGVISARVLALTEGVLKTMLLTKLKAGAFAILAAGLVLLASALALGRPSEAIPPDAEKPAGDRHPASKAQREPPKDRHREALPAGALGRLGSPRFRHGGQPFGQVVFSSDGRHLASTTSRGVYLYDAATGGLVHHLRPPAEHLPRVVRFLADGKRLAVGSGDWHQTAEVTIYGLANGKALASSSFAGKSQIFIIDVTADGGRILVEDRFVRVYLWDVKIGKEVWEFEHPEASSTLPFTADSTRLVLARSRKAELRDAATGKVVSAFPQPGPRFPGLYSAALAPDGRLAISAEKRDAVAVLDARGPGTMRTLPADRQTNRLVFSPDGRHLAGFGPYATLVWNLKATGDKAPAARLPAAAHGGFSPDGKTLALDDHGFVTLWRTREWKRLPQSAEPATPVWRVGFSADGTKVLGYTRGGWVDWPVDGGPATALSDGATVHHEGLAELSADGRVAVDVLHEPGPGREQGKFALRVTELKSGKARRIALDKEPWEPIRISPDGRYVSASLQGSEFVVWDAATGEVLHRRPRPQDRVLFGADAAADGKGLARSVAGVWLEGRRGLDLGPMYSAVIVANHRTGREWKMAPLPLSVYSGGARFSRDGSKLVLLGRFGGDWKEDSVSVWDARTGKRLLNWDRRSGRLASVCLSADGRSLLAGDGSGRLVLLEVATGGERAAYRHGGIVLSAAFHPNGTRAVACSPEAPVYVWDLLGEPGRWGARKGDAVWTDLGSAEAKVAFAAVRKLRANPGQAVAFLRERVKVPAVPSKEAVTGWLKGLDSPVFAARQQAQKALTAAAELIRPQLEAARKTASVETSRRLDQVLNSSQTPTPERLRQIRACEVLEGIGSTEAVEVLRGWAAGPEGAWLTVEAAMSLARRGPALPGA
jgi:RNA polymerase sigma factor (sigma-70 family)